MGEPEHRIATIAFFRFGGVDRLLAGSGPEAASEAIELLVSAIQGSADQEEVTFLGTDVDAGGGKIILAGGVPLTREDDEGRILRVARRGIESGSALSLQVGVNRGHVFAGDIGTDFRSTYTVIGDAVNLAARLMAAAPVGGLLATATVLDRSHTRFDAAPVEPFAVKGKRALVQAYSVGEEVGSRLIPSFGELPFVGRAAELSRFELLLAGLREGQGGSVTVTGEPGVGKSRLVREAVVRAGDVREWMVTAEPNGADNPYWAFRDPLRRLLGIERSSQAEMARELDARLVSLGSGLDRLAPLIGDAAHIEVAENDETASIEPRFRPGRVGAAIVALLEAALPGPLVLLVEDVHWLDDASAALLDLLRLAAGERPWQVVGTTRLPSATDPGEQIHLEPLGAVDAHHLAEVATDAAPLRPDQIETIVRRAGGNPLFLTELLQVVRTNGDLESMPDSLDAVVATQIDALQELARRLLRYSSVLGTGFRKKVLDRFLAPENIVLDAATRRSLARFIVEDGPERWRFRHGVIRDVAYQGLSYQRRRLLHARAAEVIEELAGDDVDTVAEFLALHHAQAGNHAQAWRHSLVAGRRAKTGYFNLEAGGHFERALEASRRLADLDGLTIAQVWSDLGEVRELAGLYAGSVAAFRAAIRLSADPLTTAELRSKLARARARMGSFGPAFREITIARREVGSTVVAEAKAVLARLSSLEAQLRQLQEHPHAAITIARRAVAEAEEAGEEVALARACQVLDASYNMVGRPGQAVFGARALEVYERHQDLGGIAAITNNLGGQAYFEGRWADALDFYARAESAHRKAGNEPAAATTSANRGEVLVSQGRYDEAEVVLSPAVRVLRTYRLMDAALFADVQLARLHLLRGEVAEATARLGAIREEATRLGLLLSAFESALHIADGLVLSGRPDEAIALLEEARSNAGREVDLYRPMLARVEGSALLAAGRPAEAGPVVAAGIGEAEAEGLVYEKALLMVVEAGIMERSGEGGGQARLEEARGLLQSLGVVVAALPVST
jgi:class 3 adenylate cyclase/tetratricopeptide (TPR) repeat protein